MFAIFVFKAIQRIHLSRYPYSHFTLKFSFVLHGHVVLKQQWNRVVVVRKQEILLLSEVSSLYSVACTADLAGILVSVDATTAKESLYSYVV